MEMNFSLIDGNFDMAGEASGKIKRVMQRLGLPASIIRRIAIATYEAEINALIHAAEGSIKLEVTPEVTYITVSDKGPGIPDVKKAMEEGWSTASDEARALGFGAGMGLPNMLSCSDDFNLETEVGKGTVVKMEFKNRE